MLSYTKELGRLVGVSLLKEMRFLGELKNDKNLDDLLDIPGRDKLSFQVINGEDAAKSSKYKGNFGVALAGLRFCVADGEVERIGMMDIDHTVPFKYINRKQEALLEYLNQALNVDFAEGFLNAVSKVDDHELNMSDYFKRNTNKQIQGTRRFFRLCYNDIDNLLLICHSCNIEKGAKDSLEWFKKQEPFLGERFIDAVTKAGGLHDGIIVKKICKVSEDGKDIIRLGEFDCRIHNGEAKGLGDFINDWFESENPEYAQDLVEAYSGVWLGLKEIYEQQLVKKASGDDEKRQEAQNAGKKLTYILKAGIDVVEKHYNIKSMVKVRDSGSQPSRSSGDDSIDKKSRITEIDEKIKEVLHYMHGLKKIQYLIAANEPMLATSENKEEMYSYYKELQISSMDLVTQRKFFNELKDELIKEYYRGKKDHSVADIKEIIFNIANKLTLRHKLTQLESTLEEERKARLIAEEAVLEQTKSRMLLEARIAELEAELPPEKRAKISAGSKPVFKPS